MNRKSILPADTYVVINKTVMSDADRKVLTMLYQPIVGVLPISLYFSLWSDLDKAEMMSIPFNHHHLITNMKIKLEDIVTAREKLEGVGLLKTYFKKGEINSYVYQLYSPISAAEFLSHPLLGVLFFNNVGDKEYNRTVNYFKIPKINVSEFEDITLHFSDVFKMTSEYPKEMIDDTVELKKKNKNDIEIEETIDAAFLKEALLKSNLNEKGLDSAASSLINKLAFLYKIDTEHMINIVRGCINEKGLIDKLKLRTDCRNYYQFENSNKLPNLIYHSQPENLRTNKIDDSKRSKIIYTFETLSPYDFLRGKYNGGSPISHDVKIIESLMVEQALKPGVVNVLIDYVFRINDKKLNKNFIETIAGQWKRLNIETVEDAMKQAEKEYKKQRSSLKETRKVTKEEVLPDWFNKDIKEEKIAEEEEQKLKDMLKEFAR